MLRFIFGNDRMYAAQKAAATEHCWRYDDQLLPPGCRPSRAAVGVYHDPDSGEVFLYIGKGIAFSGRNPAIRHWLAEGQKSFPSIDAMRAWIQGEFAAAYAAPDSPCPWCGKLVGPAGGRCPRCRRNVEPSSILAEAARLLLAPLDAARARLLTGSASLLAIAAQANVPEVLARPAFDLIQRDRPTLRSVVRGEDLLLYENPFPAESVGLSILSRFKAAGQQRRRLERLLRQRALLAGRLDELDRRMAGLEREEAMLLDRARVGVQGSAREARDTKPLDSKERHLLSRIVTLRQDAGHLLVLAGVARRQMEVASAELHNLTLLLRAGAGIPTATELATTGEQAESAVAELQATTESAGSVQTETTALAATETEIDALMRELEGQPSAAPRDTPVVEPRKEPPRQFESCA